MQNSLADIETIILKSERFKKTLLSPKIQGLYGALKSFFIAQLSKNNPTTCIITPWPDELFDDIKVWTNKRCDLKEAILIPSWDESRPSEMGRGQRVPPPLEIMSDLYYALNSLIKSAPVIVVTNPKKGLPSPELVKKNVIYLNTGSHISMSKLVNKLAEFGFNRVGTVEELGEFAVRGGIIDCWPYGRAYPLRVEFMADEITSIREFDPLIQTSVSRVRTAEIMPINLPQGDADIKDYLDKDALLIYDTIKEVEPQEETNRPYVYLGEGYDVCGKSSYQGNLNVFNQTLAKLKHYKVFVICENETEKSRLLEIFPELEVRLSDLSEGFILPDAELAVFTYSDIFGRKIRVKPIHPFKGKGIPIEDLQSLQPGDFVVHVDYGIGLYQGLKRIQVNHTEIDCLLILYKDEDKLYVPFDKLRYIERYIGHYERPPELTALGSGAWERKKNRARKAIQDLTNELLSLYAERKISKGYKFSPDNVWQAKLESSFPYEETQDQLKVINEIKMDMESEKSMDRLVCGEVGYGKTEVALRAAFKAVMDGKQVALLCPTTILAEQHLRTFKQRLIEFPVKVESLSRFNTRMKQQKIVAGLKRGDVDIVIGTHRLLGNDVQFNDLGLLIIDEEHRFGVQQKEKLKKLKKGIDTISLTATPIPRTLYMSLTRIRDLSELETPPKGRLPIVTQISMWDENLIKQVIIREIQRGGQVYFVHNRIRSINIIANLIRKLDPNFNVGIAHSELSERELEEVMLKFLIGDFNILVSTAIIGSGIDIPQVNTIIINRADRFGLADLHQLRGRVGRSDVRAYCYLLIPKYITKEAKRRLQTMITYTELGAGFKIAIRDLELRGAGNLLGREQHGHIHAIGYELYTQLLSEEIKRIKGEVVQKRIEPTVDLGINCYIPDYYVDPARKFSLYKRLSSADSLHEINEFKHELIDRFGPLPQEVESLLLAIQIKILARDAGITKVINKGREFGLKFLKLPKKTLLNHPLVTWVGSTKGTVEIRVSINDPKKLKSFITKIKT
ncbi:MAG: transcription-repair coupling factor [bacterium]|nr:transcription-repair coupling factor [bacterium]